MGPRTTHLLTVLSLILALPMEAQDDAYKGRYQANYKRFTRGDDTKVIDEAWGRLEWFRERMGGDLGPDFTRHLLSEAEKERVKYPSLFRAPGGPEMPVALNGTSWTSLGPTTSDFTQNGIVLNKVDSGRLRTILPDTADATGNTVYVLASGGGLWKTTNFLSNPPTWTPLTDFIGSNISGSVAFGGVTSTLYVGAGDPFDLGIGGFMVKSTNGGGTWSSSIKLGTASKIYDIKVDAAGSDIVLAGTNTGLFRSSDAGANYAAVASIPSTLKVWSLEKTSAGWLAATETTTGVGALYRSTDQGATWASVSVAALGGVGRITLGIGLPGDSVVYAYAANTGDAAQLDLFRSTDGGLNWTALAITGKVPTNANADNPTMDLMDGQPWYNHMILVDPSDAARNTVYLGGQLGSAKTVNGGSTWTLTSNWLAQYGLPYIHADFHCAAYSNLGGTPRLYFGTDGGIFTSTDGGTTWDDTKNKGLVNHLIYALAANPGVAGSALIGLQDNGTRIRSGLTSTFNQVRGGDGFGVGWAQDVTTASAVSMSSYVYNYIRRSTVSPVVDQTNWISFTTGLASAGSSSVYNFVTPIVTPPKGADPTGQVYFTYSKTGVIYQSNATGWTAIGTAGTGGITAGRTVRAVSHGVGVSPMDLQHLAAAGTGGYLLMTANGGGAWTEVFLGAEPTTPGLVTGWQGFNANIAWANNSLLYVCSEAPGTGAVRVAKSANGGGTWTAAATGLPDVPVTKLAVDPGDGTGNTVYAATWLGVYRTTNGGASWSVFGTGLPQGRATDIWVAPDSSSIRVSTWGRGVWEMANAPVAGTVNITPTSAFLYTGDTATFTGTVNGGGTVIYTATGGTITTGGVFTAGSANGDFAVTATNTADPAQKAIASITVAVPVPVTFPTQPASITAAVGHKATFSVVASGSGTLTYQWKKGGVAISGATASSYTTPTLALGDSGSVFTCDVTGRAGMVASNPATLTVQALGTAVTVSSTTVTTIPDATTTAPGTPVEISFTVSGLTGNIGEVQFALYLTHTWVGDLDVTLVAPDLSTVSLARLINGGNIGSTTGVTAAFGTSCGTYTTFSDLGTASIQTQTSANLPLTGIYIPNQLLDRFNGKSPNGTWKLRIQDLGPVDVGTFNCGVLTVKPLVAASFDLDGNGVGDLRDLLFFAKYHGTTGVTSASPAFTCDLNSDGSVNDADLTLLLAGL
ncbi:MAG: proprotein convertase P-domain-containing protein [Geothrix sp.]|nr:proprotein convertase P-domain-containing protein [Geothrix sp.]